MQTFRFDNKFKNQLLREYPFGKVRTMRLDNKGVKKDDIIIIQLNTPIKNFTYKKAKVKNVYQQSINEMNGSDIYKEGYRFENDILRDLQNYYSAIPINEYTKFWVIEFRLIEE